MADLLRDTVLGPLQIIEIYEYYDGPRIFSCRTAYRQLLLVFWIDATKEDEEWYLVPISRRRLRSLERAELDLRDAIGTPEGDLLWKVTIPRDGEAVAEILRGGDIDPETLPIKGERLRAPDMALIQPSKVAAGTLRHGRFPPEAQIPTFFNIFEQQALHRDDLTRWSQWRAAQEQRDVLNVILQPIEGGHEVDATALGQTLLQLQGVVDSINDVQSNAGNSRLRVAFAFPGSFGVQLISDARADLLSQTPVGASVQRLIELVKAGEDEDRLRAMLSDLRLRTARRYREFIRALTKSRSGLVLEWASPSKAADYATLSRASAFTVANVLARIERDLPNEYPVIGTLVAVHLRLKTFELWEQGPRKRKKYSGTIAEQAADDLSHATVGNTYRAIIRETVETVTAIGDRKLRYELLSLRSVNPEV